MRGVVEQAIRLHLSEGQLLRTPTREAPFTIARIDADGIVLLLGVGEWQTRISWLCLEGVVPYMRELGGSVEIGGRHEVVGKARTLDAHLKECVKRTTAGWVAVVLEEARIVRLERSRPARVVLLSS